MGNRSIQNKMARKRRAKANSAQNIQVREKFMTQSRKLFVADTIMVASSGLVGLYGASILLSYSSKIELTPAAIALGWISFAIYLICFVTALILKK